MILPSYGRVFRYHLGSLALGSFLIAVVQFIRYLLLKLQKSVRSRSSRMASPWPRTRNCACIDRVGRGE